MKKISIVSIGFLILGILLLLVGTFYVSIPITLNWIFLYKAYALKYKTSIAGILCITLALFALCARTRRTRKKIRNFLTNLTVALIALFICFSILGVAGYFIFSNNPSAEKYAQEDPVLHHAHIPNAETPFITREWNVNISINSEGLRDDEIKAKDEYDGRILMLGDSFTFGFGIEHEKTFSSVLENLFSEQGQKIDVINTGVVSYSPLPEYLYLREKGLKYNPDVVIMNFDMSDVWGDYIFEKTIIIDAKGRITNITQEEKQPKKKLFTKIKIVDFLNQKTNSVIDRWYANLAYKPQMDRTYVYDIEHNRYAITLDEREKIVNEEELWERSFEYIIRTKELAEKNNAEFILVIYPYGHQVSVREWDLGRHHFGLATDKVYGNHPEEILKEFAEKNDVTLFNMFPVFKESKTYPLYFRFDGHFNNNGHQLMAESMYEELTKRNII